MERLRTAGFLFTRTDVAPPVLTGNYGDGYQPPGAVIGNPAGVRSWNARIDVLPDSETAQVELKTRAAYLWEFFLASKAAADEAFYLYDHKDDLFYLASFVDDTLTFEILCAKVFSTGLGFRQRRVIGLNAPIVGVPILDHLGLPILDSNDEPIVDSGVY